MWTEYECKMAGLRDENVVRVMHIAQAYFFCVEFDMFDVCYKKLLEWRWEIDSVVSGFSYEVEFDVAKFQ